MATLASFNADVLLRLPGTGDYVNSAGRDAAVLQAAKIWNRYKPQHLVADIAGDGGYDYDLPASFTLGFSQIERIEYPLGEREPSYLDADAYSAYRTASAAAQIRFYHHTPATGETARISYTAMHVIGASSTIDSNDEAALADLATSHVAEWVSSWFSQASDSSLVVDSRDYKSQATEYALRAKRFRQIALEHLGIGTTSEGSASGAVASSVPASGIIRDFDSERMDRSIRLTHPQR